MSLEVLADWMFWRDAHRMNDMERVMLASLRGTRFSVLGGEILKSLCARYGQIVLRDSLSMSAGEMDEFVV